MVASFESRSAASVAIVGAGKVGTALGVLARRHGLRVTAITSRSLQSARIAARRIGGEVEVCRLEEVPRYATLILLTVPDDTIESLCETLCRGAVFQPGSVVVHCSGALTSEVLSTARERSGCAVASFHPLQSFPTIDAALDNLPGSHCFVEGDADARTRLEAFGEAIGVHCVEIETEAKVRYHAAAVVACNYLASLMDAALSLMRRAGIEDELAWAGLEPLVRATLDNISVLGPEQALTGPVARNERGTLEAHLEALQGESTDLADLYRIMGRFTVGLARRRGDLDEAAAQDLLSLFDGGEV